MANSKPPKAPAPPRLSSALMGLRQIVFTTRRAPSEAEAESAGAKAYAVRRPSDLNKELALRSPRARSKR